MQQGSRVLRASICFTLRKRSLINGATSHPLPTGTLKQSYATVMVSEALHTTGSKVILLADNNAWPIITLFPAQPPSHVELSKAVSWALSLFFSTSTIFLFVPKLPVSSYSLMILTFYFPIVTLKYLNLYLILNFKIFLTGSN